MEKQAQAYSGRSTEDDPIDLAVSAAISRGSRPRNIEAL